MAPPLIWSHSVPCSNELVFKYTIPQCNPLLCLLISLTLLVDVHIQVAEERLSRFFCQDLVDQRAASLYIVDVAIRLAVCSCITPKTRKLYGTLDTPCSLLLCYT